MTNKPDQAAANFYLDELRVLKNHAGDRDKPHAFALATAMMLQETLDDNRDIPCNDGLELLMRVVWAIIQDPSQKDYIQAKLNLGVVKIQNELGIE